MDDILLLYAPEEKIKFAPFLADEWWIKKGQCMNQKNDDDMDEELENFEITDEVMSKARLIPAKNNAGRKKIGRRISIVLPEEVIEELTDIGKQKGLGYQTIARLFIMQKVEDEKSLKKAG